MDYGMRVHIKIYTGIYIDINGDNSILCILK